MKIAEIVVQIILNLWLVWLLPCILLAFIRRTGRIAFFLLGIAFAFIAPWLAGPQGPDSVLLVLPVYGLLIAFAAALAEIPAFFIRGFRKRRAAALD